MEGVDAADADTTEATVTGVETVVGAEEVAGAIGRGPLRSCSGRRRSRSPVVGVRDEIRFGRLVARIGARFEGRFGVRFGATIGVRLGTRFAVDGWLVMVVGATGCLATTVTLG